jgi:hypothetical protein
MKISLSVRFSADTNTSSEVMEVKRVRKVMEVGFTNITIITCFTWRKATIIRSGR